MTKCRICREPYLKRSMSHVACSPACAQIVAQRKREKEQRQRDKLERMQIAQRKEAIKRRSDHVNELQVIFNRFIRLRDAGKPCICCGKPFEPQKPGGSMDAGHYLSRGSAPHLRFDERNVHGQRKNCNRPGGTTRVAFRAGMIERIGRAAVEALEADQTSRSYTIPELVALKKHYSARIKELSKKAETA